MCGICGIIDFHGTFSEAQRRGSVEAMNQAMLHRGPDESGTLHQSMATLAMRRLAIIDLSNGNQPIYNETGDIAVVFNGEIYNYADLKKELIKEGHVFKTDSDTEVLVHLYESYGTAFIEKLRGIFAFCIHDIRKNIFLLSRDRFGEKPLYYHFDGKTFSFASEIKALLENTSIPRVLNIEALPYYFRTSLVPEPITLFKNIESLAPGQFMVVTPDGIKIDAYFEPNYTTTENFFRSEEEAIKEIEPLLRNAVRKQMISDVPIGAFLSGGIDSSTIVALMQQQSDRPIKTFNVRFEDEEYDESAIAKKVAEHCGTEHHELFIPNLDFDETIFWTIIDHVGLPFRDSSAIPTYLISQEISKSVKVALSGDGGDELFGGYSLFQWYQKILNFKKIAKPIRATADIGLSLLQKTPGLRSSSQIRKIKRGVRTSLETSDDIAIALNELFSQQQIKEIGQGSTVLKSLTKSMVFPLLKSFPANYQYYSNLRKIMYYRLRHTLPANMLIKVDRMSMANALEVRSPFLDPDLFEVTKRIPDNFLINQGKGKYLLRKIMKSHLPDSVFNHPKKGFSIPLSKYQNENYKALAKRLLFEENPLPELIAPITLQKIYQRGIQQNRDSASMSVFQSSHQLWMMMQLLGWAKRFNVTLA